MVNDCNGSAFKSKLSLTIFVIYCVGMGENVILQLVLKRVDAVLAGQEEMRAELKAVSKKVDGQASTLVGIRRELRELREMTWVYCSRRWMITAAASALKRANPRRSRLKKRKHHLQLGREHGYEVQLGKGKSLDEKSAL